MERFEHTTIEVVPIRTLSEALDRMLLPADIPVSESPVPVQTLPAAVLSAEEQTAAGKT